MQDFELILSGFASGNLRKETCDAVIMGEVLEHVEEPYSLLERIREVVLPDGFVFVLTCIIAPSKISSLIS
ncbi:MAG: class I SAM-dependent methyltransferase [Proteobacteria bacterium]|nr:class I SAM-dependent methyltransferase [Pseudomonadota bacterium]